MLGRCRPFTVAHCSEATHAKESTGVLPTEEHHPAISRSEGASTHPHDVAGRHQLVELTRVVALYPSAQDVALPHAGRDGNPLQLGDHLVDPVDSASGAAHAVPPRKETHQGVWFSGSDLVAESGQRPLSELAQNGGVAPLPLGTPGPESTAGDGPVGLELLQKFGHAIDGEPQSASRFGGEEGSVGAGPPTHQLKVGAGNRLEERVGDPDRETDAEGVAVAARIFGSDEPVLAGHADPHCSTRPNELFVVRPVLRASRQLLGREIAETAKQVVSAVEVVGPAALVEGLELGLKSRQGISVDQLAQLIGTHQLGQHPPIEREGLGPALGQGGVALVHEVGHVGEGQRRRERRR